jgi:hypothetical protein
MKHVNRMKSLFFVLAILFSLLSITNSGAISQGRMERQTYARISADDKALLQLEGFRNGIYDMENQYRRFGSITNNSDQEIKLTVTIHPYFLDMKNKNSWFGVKIKSNIVQFHADSVPGQISVVLLPRETVHVEAALHPGQNTTVLSSFQFTAADAAGNFITLLDDTLQNPRRMICY